MNIELNNIIFQIISKLACREKIPVYVTGGFVRDVFLNRDSKDIDIVCKGSGIELAIKTANELGVEPAAVYKNFGTALIKWNDIDVEFVGARKESYRLDSRKPIVEDGSLEDDQKRRDFTINALAFSLNKQDFGTLIDPFSGVKDLQDKLIRTPLEPDITFSDDPLRMMRAVRFASQLKFTIFKNTFESIARNRERIKIISKERIHEELNKIILSEKPSYGFELLFRCGLLEIIFPQLVQLQGVDTVDGQSHKDNFYHTLQVLDNISLYTGDLWLRWAALLHDIAKPQTKRFEPGAGWTFHGHEDRGARMVPKIFSMLKLPQNEKMVLVQKLVKLHLRPIALVDSIVTDSAVRRLLFEAGEAIDDLMMLCRADITSKNDKKVKRYLRNFDEVEKRMKEVEEKDKLRNWQPCINGSDIMKAFNLSPSPIIGEIKNAIREAVLDGIIKNVYDEGYKFMIEKGKEMGLEEVGKSL